VSVELRTVGPEAFDDVLPLLQEFPTRRMTPEDWRFMVFGYPWATESQRGYGLYADGKAVGFLGTILVERRLQDRPERLCHLTCWVVRDEHRHASLLLLKPLLAMADRTIVNLIPSPTAYQIFARIGFRPLESEQLLLAPLSLGAGVRRGDFTTAPEEIDAALAGEERRLHRELAASPIARHVLLRHGGRACYLVATPARRRGVPFAELQYIGDRGFFWDHLGLAHAALVRSLKLSGLVLAVDRRFAETRRLPLALRWPRPRLYRPAHADLAPVWIDGLYSELMGLRY
jgi:hypothetical protein